MRLEERIDLCVRLGHYMEQDPEWEAVTRIANTANAWFVPEFTAVATNNIVSQFLREHKLKEWAGKYDLREAGAIVTTVGIVMAGNIPMVGFHDFLCGFISGHQLVLKPSSRDSVLIKHIVKKLADFDSEVNNMVIFKDQLKGCDAYIATGSNNSSRYFEYYFRNYSSIIRKNRTSVAVLTGKETKEDLELLADDLLLYFGLGCRNVSKLYVPVNYNFEPLLNALNKYKWMEDHHKFRNNYDYSLSLHILNHKYYMTNGTVLLTENASLFSPISQINFEYYADHPPANLKAEFPEELQCVVGQGSTEFGKAQMPGLQDYADNVDTMRFFTSLYKD